MQKPPPNPGTDTEHTIGGKHPPSRIITRLIAEMHAAIAGPGIRLMGGNVDRFIIMTLITHKSLGRNPGISAYSLAGSLALPYETVRRQVRALMARGWVEHTAQNAIIVNPTVLSSVSDLLTLIHDSFVRFVSDIAMLKAIPLPANRVPRADAEQWSRQHGVQAAADIMLAVAHGNVQPGRDLTDLSIIAFIRAANTPPDAHDPALAWLLADHRTPVRASAIARASGHAENTIRRRIKEMIATGSLVQVKGGLLVSESWENAPEAVAIALASYQNIQRLFIRCAAEGFPFSAPETAYIAGRPADVSFTPLAISDSRRATTGEHPR